MKGGGKCSYCSQHFSQTVITEHLKSCDIRKENSPYLKRDQYSFLIRISDVYTTNYWVFVEVDGRTCLLKDIDSFLRKLWLECCGHLSSFRINNQVYDSDHDPSDYDAGSKNMQVRVDKILNVGTIFEYTYDFGTSTELVLEVIDARVLDREGDVEGSRTNGQIRAKRRSGSKSKGRIIPRVKLVARNDPLPFTCHACKKVTATNICTVCLDEQSRKGASFCKACAGNHECGEDMTLPIVNSPRSGQCGYTGIAY